MDLTPTINSWRAAFSSSWHLDLEDFALTVSLKTERLEPREGFFDKVQIHFLVKRTTKKVATQINFQKANGEIRIIVGKDYIPSSQWDTWTHE